MRPEDNGDEHLPASRLRGSLCLRLSRLESRWKSADRTEEGKGERATVHWGLCAQLPATAAAPRPRRLPATAQALTHAQGWMRRALLAHSNGPPRHLEAGSPCQLDRDKNATALPCCLLLLPSNCCSAPHCSWTWRFHLASVMDSH